MSDPCEGILFTLGGDKTLDPHGEILGALRGDKKCRILLKESLPPLGDQMRWILMEESLSHLETIKPNKYSHGILVSL